MAVPIDSIESKESKDFLYPIKIGEHDVILLSYDTAGEKVRNKIEYARAKLVEAFLETKYEKILFLDSDIIVDPEDLLPLVESEHLVAFALYPYRAYWTGKEKIPQYPKEISILLQGGLGTCCIHREAFRKMEQPYFGRRGRITCWKREDWNFFRNCQRAKITTWVYPDIRVGHQDRETGEIYYFNKDKTKIIRIEGREYADSQTR